jgi:sec-independent protein translocase protein TatA
MGSFGGFEWLVIIMVVLLLFGAKKIPELARGLGQGLTEFRKASTDIRKEIERGAQEPTYSEREAARSRSAEPQTKAASSEPANESSAPESASEKKADDTSDSSEASSDDKKTAQ